MTWRLWRRPQAKFDKFASGITIGATLHPGARRNPEDVPVGFSDSGSNFQDFTPEEQACISSKIRKLKDEGKPQDQAIAIAISTCAPSKSKGAKAQASTEGKTTMTTATAVKIEGGKYRAIDTGDGYFTIKDMPIMSTLKKGVKNAPEDITEARLNGMVQFARDRYATGKFASPAHIGHNDEMFKPEADAVGFFLPARVAPGLVDGETRPCIFSDVKVRAATFTRIQNGELPYVSPEINDWKENRISSLSFLSAKSPFFEFPLVTIGEVTTDVTAKFEAVADPDAKFAGTGIHPGDPIRQDPKGAKTMTCPHCHKEMPNGGKMAKKDDDPNHEPGKPVATPAAQPNAIPALAPQGVRMEDIKDPAVAAHFAAMRDENATLKGRLDMRDNADVAKDLAAVALTSLSEYQIGEETKKQIASFAAEGKEKLEKFVATIKEIAVKNPPRTVMEAQAAGVSLEDPALAKFADKGPEVAQKAAKFLGQYRQIKDSPAGKGMTQTAEQFIQYALDTGGAE